MMYTGILVLQYDHIGIMVLQYDVHWYNGAMAAYPASMTPVHQHTVLVLVALAD